MRILIISALFPPHVQGGAELSAGNLARWLVAQGHEVGVLTTSPNPDDELSGAQVGDVTIWRTTMPRSYTVFDAAQRSGWQKPVWHLQDHFDPRNKTIVANVLDAFKPDVANIHIIQGIGYNAILELAKRDIPTVFMLHDLSLACVKMAMFVNGSECRGLCRACSFSARVKMGFIRKMRRVGFVSPSAANLAKLSGLLPIRNYPTAHILNPNKYPTPTVRHETSKTVRLLYVGRLHETKGVDVALDALEPLADQHDFTFTVVGTGPDAESLKKRCVNHKWVTFTGHVSMEEVANRMVGSDMLLVPSIWQENSPGVVIQALGESLPVMGSNKGGIPELVVDGLNGILVPPGDVEAWRAALKRILQNPAQLAALRDNARRGAHEFEQDTLGNKLVNFFETVRQGPAGVALPMNTEVGVTNG
ncbi:glycosyltransferase family 4 protein [Bradyrhizobium sp. URHA0013]|uniref:glycosyltransferase family 4 protein n=1 Tax=Bradyrhizobium sp. URHA0013 TaxID=1380352 RepID=UPI000482E6C6|nr:glycosyltransferase family 4 protein [Bradyrhizobium sp. URHA0013]